MGPGTSFAAKHRPGEEQEDQTMFVRGITLSLATMLAAAITAESALADHDRRKPRRIIVEEGYYPGPPIIRDIPGLRIFFGDYALSEEEFDALYGTPPRRANRYDDKELQQKPKRKASEREKQKQKQQQKSKTAAKQAEQKKTASKADSGLSCEKATSVVSGYGFSSVTPSSCSGKVYAFNATRDGKSFAIKLDPASGELTEVKKLP
jgi:hypothetical protein